VNSANIKLRFSKTVTGQYGPSIVLQQVNVQSDHHVSWCTHCLVRGRGALTVGAWSQN